MNSRVRIALVIGLIGMLTHSAVYTAMSFWYSWFGPRQAIRHWLVSLTSPAWSGHIAFYCLYLPHWILYAAAGFAVGAWRPQRWGQYSLLLSAVLLVSAVAWGISPARYLLRTEMPHLPNWWASMCALSILTHATPICGAWVGSRCRSRNAAGGRADSDLPEGPKCPACGYLLLGLQGHRCPECGKPIPASSVPSEREGDRST